jgi:hypothetical protein
MPIEPAGKITQIGNDLGFRLVKLVRIAPVGQQQLDTSSQLAQPGGR